MPAEIKRPENVWMKPVQHMRRRRAKTRREFFRARRAAYFLRGFQHDHLAPRLGKNRGGDEAVMAPADDDHIR